MEAGCLEWCVVIGLILRDANVIKQVIGFLDSPEVPQETVQSVRNGLLAIDSWASTDWWVLLCLLRHPFPCPLSTFLLLFTSFSLALFVPILPPVFVLFINSYSSFRHISPCAKLPSYPSSSLGYKPFLNLIQPQLQELMDTGSEQVQPEAFQSVSQSSKLTCSEGLGGVVVPRPEDSRGVTSTLVLGLPSMEPAGSFSRPPEDCPPEQTEEQNEEEGSYDCTLS